MYAEYFLRLYRMPFFFGVVVGLVEGLTVQIYIYIYA